MTIDLNRGAECHFHPTGVHVYMYFDDPGVFLSWHGTQVADSLARESGYDVDLLRRESEKRKRVAQALAGVEQEFSETTQREIVEERGGYQMLHLGMGRYQIRDPDGNNVTPRAFPEQEARVLLGKLAPETAASDKEEAA